LASAVHQYVAHSGGEALRTGIVILMLPGAWSLVVVTVFVPEHIASPSIDWPLILVLWLVLVVALALAVSRTRWFLHRRRRAEP
jgi:membrane protein implicated in regulation of membrane protease activity